MLFTLTLLTGLSSVASAFPFKRYDNETASPVVQYSSQDVTFTIDKYITTTLSSLSPHSSSYWTGASTLDTVTSVVTEYITKTIGGSTTTSPISTYTTTVPDVNTTSTLTNYVTVTENGGSISTEAMQSHAITSIQATTEACVCIPSTVTVTVPNTASSTENQISTITLTTVASYPVVGEFTLSGSTTKITSYVEITITETSYTHLLSTATPAFSSFNNGTSASSMRAKRGFYYNL